jgi:hypothetical protein
MAKQQPGTRTWSNLPRPRCERTPRRPTARLRPRLRAGLTAALAALAALPASNTRAAEPAAALRKGEFEIQVVDAETNQPIAANLFLRNERGKSIPAAKLPFWKDHFAFAGSVVLQLAPGKYTFDMERGPEYKIRSGEFVIESGASDNTQVSLERFVDMKKEGWWSGDLHIHRAAADIPLLMLAQDLHVAPVITWWNEKNPWKNQPLPDPPLVQFDNDRFYQLLAGEDERGGGALLYFNAARPLDLASGKEREYPSMCRFAELARQQTGVHIDVEKPFWWDTPVWVALGLADSIGLAHNHLQRSGMMANEAWGKPRDTKRYPAPLGTGYWSQDIYYHLLNCGLRLPPSAGSASGVLENPVGYNRVYVHCGDTLTYDGWWEGLRAGRVLVTNGPLLRPRVNGELPGHVFHAPAGEAVELTVALDLALRDRVEYLEIVQNGRVAHEVRLDEYREKRGKLPPVKFETSGWLLVRAMTTNPQTFRFASTGPYYVEIGQQPRISRKSAQFFVDWMDERIARLKLDDAQQKTEVMSYLDRAREFWQQKLAEANAD